MLRRTLHLVYAARRGEVGSGTRISVVISPSARTVCRVPSATKYSAAATSRVATGERSTMLAPSEINTGTQSLDIAATQLRPPGTT